MIFIWMSYNYRIKHLIGGIYDFDFILCELEVLL